MAVSYQRNDRLIRRKFYQYLVPTVIMAMVMQLGSLADAILIGNILGPDALSASSLGLPVVFLVELPGMAISIGAAIVAANFIGKRRVEEASKVFKISLLMTFLLSLPFIPVGIFAAEPISRLLAGNFPELIPLITQYVRMYLCLGAVINLGLVIAYFLPSDNHPNLGAAYLIIASVIHIVALVALSLPSSFSMEGRMAGAASSLAIGMFAGFVVLIPYLRSKKRAINLKVSMKGSFKLLKGVFRSGSTNAAMVFLMFVYTLVINLAATQYLAAPDLPAFAMLNNFSFVIDLFIIGPLQLMSSVIPALFGEKDYFGVKSVCRRVLTIVISITVLLTAVSLIFPQMFFYIFNVEIASGTAIDPLLVVRIFVLSFLLYVFIQFTTYYYPAIMVNSPGVVSNVTRIGAVGPVVLYFCMAASGVLGYAYGTIITNAAALVIVIVFLLIGKKLQRFKGKGLLLLPKAGEKGAYLDISIPAKQEEISKVSEELQRFAGESTHDEKSSAMLALACEEVMSNIIAYGYQRKHSAEYIDLALSQTEDRFLVRIRDDGIAFDPTEYVAEDGEEFQFHGIEVVRKVATEFKYLRVLNTNNTIMEIKIAKQ